LQRPWGVQRLWGGGAVSSESTLRATSGNGETGCDGDPRCVAYRMSWSSYMRIFCGNGPPTRVAAVAKRRLAVILAIKT
jgi:hypothetical protein